MALRVLDESIWFEKDGVVYMVEDFPNSEYLAAWRTISEPVEAEVIPPEAATDAPVAAVEPTVDQHPPAPSAEAVLEVGESVTRQTVAWLRQNCADKVAAAVASLAEDIAAANGLDDAEVGTWVRDFDGLLRWSSRSPYQRGGSDQHIVVGNVTWADPETGGRRAQAVVLDWDTGEIR